MTDRDARLAMDRKRLAAKRFIESAVGGMTLEAADAVAERAYPEAVRLDWLEGNTRASALRLIEHMKGAK